MTDSETLQAALDALIKERDKGIIQAEELVRQRRVIGELGESVKALRHKVSASEDREVEARSAADGELRALRRALESREAELLTLAQSQGTTPRDLAALKEEVRGEVEAPLLARVAEAEGRVEAARREAHAASRELLMVQARAEVAAKEAGREADARVEAHAAALAGLHARLREAGIAADEAAAASAKSLRAAREEASLAAARAAVAEREGAALRSELDALRGVYNKETVARVREVAEAKSVADRATGSRASAERAADAARAEALALTSTVNSLSKRLAEAQSEIIQLRSEASVRTALEVGASDTSSRAMVVQQREWSHERGELEERLRESQRRVRALEALRVQEGESSGVALAEVERRLKDRESSGRALSARCEEAEARLAEVSTALVVAQRERREWVSQRQYQEGSAPGYLHSSVILGGGGGGGRKPQPPPHPTPSSPSTLFPSRPPTRTAGGGSQGSTPNTFISTAFSEKPASFRSLPKGLSTLSRGSTPNSSEAGGSSSETPSATPTAAATGGGGGAAAAAVEGVASTPLPAIPAIESSALNSSAGSAIDGGGLGGGPRNGGGLSSSGLPPRPLFSSYHTTPAPSPVRLFSPEEEEEEGEEDMGLGEEGGEYSHNYRNGREGGDGGGGEFPYPEQFFEEGGLGGGVGGGGGGGGGGLMDSLLITGPSSSSSYASPDTLRRALAASRGQCAALTRTITALREQLSASQASLSKLQWSVGEVSKGRSEAESRAAGAEGRLSGAEARWRDAEARAVEAEARLLAIKDADMTHSGEVSRALGDAKAATRREMAEEVARAHIVAATEKARADKAVEREVSSGKKAASYKKKLLTLYAQYMVLKGQLGEALDRGSAMAGDLQAAVRDARLAARGTA